MKFGLPYPEKCEFTFQAKELPLSPANKTFVTSELLAMVVKAIVDEHISLREAQISIRRLRLVSRPFYHAADPYFAIYLDNPIHGNYDETVTAYKERLSKNKNGKSSDDYERDGEDEDEDENEENDYFLTIMEKMMRPCGRYVRSLDLGDSELVRNEKRILEAAGKYCHNVEKVIFYFQESPGMCVSQSDYLSLLQSWSTYCDTTNSYSNKVQKFTARMVLDGEGGEPNFKDDFDPIRCYLTGINSLCIEIRNPYAHHTIEDPEVSDEPIDWKVFQSFFQSFPNLVSFDMRGIFVRWDQMPSAEEILSSKCKNEKEEVLDFPNLKYITIERGGLTPSNIGRLNLMFPNLTYMTIHELVSDTPNTNENGHMEELGSLMTNSIVAPRLNGLWVDECHVDDIKALLKVAPKLRIFTCFRLATSVDPGTSHENLLDTLRPFKGRHWKDLDLGNLGVFIGNELDNLFKD
ncbi:hypothetical protein BGX27_000958 [Mortierella sp. AM989]|nr:hypothetical protein BGX27_000958 [Mortierella sp. AM989]